MKYMDTCMVETMLVLCYTFYNEKRGESMTVSKAQAIANKKYQSKFDDIKVRVPKGNRQIWQDHAARQNESLNGFIIRAVSETMERDHKK